MSEAPVNVLVTGFGPFPGIEVNASALLVEHLSRSFDAASLGIRLSTAVLPTEWRGGLARLEALWDAHEPAIALHFGVSPEAPGFAVETIARNACHPAADACGELPFAAQHEATGPVSRLASLPATQIVARLRDAGIPGCLSDDAGTYLCNATLYSSLRRATLSQRPAVAGFVHIPSSLVGGGGGGLDPHVLCPLDWPSAIAGARLIIEATLSHMRIS